MQRGALHIALRLFLAFFVSLLPNIEFTPFPKVEPPPATATPSPAAAAEEGSNENAEQPQNEADEDTIALGQAPVQDAARHIQEEVRA